MYIVKALRLEANIVAMVHPDYRYSHRRGTTMVLMVVSEHYDVVLCSCILGGNARKESMPSISILRMAFRPYELSDQVF